jgi:spermidine synthase
LGIGTTPAALVAHGVDTTVVELDPVVHKFASKYFKLPSNHTAVIEDAVTYTSRLAANETAERFDYIVHDVFTGGAEPIPLFTLEFFQNLHALLKPNGVVAIVRPFPSLTTPHSSHGVFLKYYCLDQHWLT